MSRSVVFWTSLEDVLEADLATWKANGVDGFVCNSGYVVGMGGSGPQWADRQARIRDSGLVTRAHALGMKLYVGCYLTSYYNQTTPLAVWFDDAGWVKVKNHVSQFAAMTRSLGFDGVAFDGEIYVAGPSWAWNYGGNTRTVVDTRAKVRQRGAELAAGLAAAWPGLVIIVTGAALPGGWGEHVQEMINGATYASLVHVDLWGGIQSNNGIGRIVFLEPIFYKTTHQWDVTWAEALEYDRSGFISMAQARGWWRGWFGQRLRRVPFAWIDEGPSLPFDAARDPAYVAEQLAAFAEVDDVYNFAFSGVTGGFDYSPYVAAIQAASA